MFYRDYQSQLAQNVLLEKKLKEAQEISKEAIVTRRVSAQLEEIAYQQKDISDQQRQEALNQRQEYFKRISGSQRTGGCEHYDDVV